ncbi:hypothetical protein Pla22_28030 [Rubripirellula amarantea]|uniref:Uncharacterized protein n=1 Tax=Rubripirellula amarantea TaxID=2527999 RepID=A0A5C5WY01_9BACT|nr:hypothetical protein [Rubripirellula amarantea]TWT55149.1 hypothetical protein Pla22_28030 [Rubripirellula amarantea]
MSERFPVLFFTGNLWLLATLLLLIGKHQERADPYRYSFFGFAGWHSPASYNAYVLVAGVAGVVLIASALATLRKNAGG